MNTEARLKTLIGDLIVQVTVLQSKNEELENKIKDLTPKENNG